ncbi:MAG: hypothetical protein ACK56I_34595, partial [bacterium]
MLDATVGGDCHQRVAPARLGREHDPAPVRCEARRLLAAAVGQDLFAARGQVAQRHQVASLAAGDEGDRAAIGAGSRRDVVGAAEGDALGLATLDRHPVDLGRAAAVGSEVEAASVGREGRLGVDAGRG